MRKADVKVGGLYAMKVSQRLTIARVTGMSDNGGGVLVSVTNLRTGRRLILRSTRRLQCEVVLAPGSTTRYVKVGA